MDTLDFIIENGDIVFEDGVKKAALGIKDGVICDIGDIHSSARNRIDASGKMIFPGMIDVHVHFNEPGNEEWEGFKTGSAMLAAGGITTFFDMPLNGSPSTITANAVVEKAQLGKQKSLIDFGLWGGLVPGNECELEDMAKEGVIGFKAFLSPSGNDEFEACDDDTLLRGMDAIAQLHKVLALHAESGPLTTFLQHKKMRNGLTSIDDYAASRPIEAEAEAVARALYFAKQTGCSLHFVHISSSEAVNLIQNAKKQGVDVTLETCPHYLIYSHEDFRRLGSVAKCAPPLRKQRDKEKLIKHLLKNEIDLISSDHSPCPWEYKEQDNMFKVWGGISGGQFSLLSAIELAKNYQIPLESVVKWTASHPAKRFGLYPKKGAIQIGSDADLAIVAMNTPFFVSKENLFAKHPYSLYENHTFPCTIDTTMQKGNIIYQNGEISYHTKGNCLKPAVNQMFYANKSC
ncbi:allantoinase [Heyndrickxia ginsengihumi]|uniref:allantoinase n=1 Tax=Heyndrickxia ginsengihumi TaxID=363870 RepID=UPI003D20F790